MGETTWGCASLVDGGSLSDSWIRMANSALGDSFET
jgi:hypothetical protein